MDTVDTKVTAEEIRSFLKRERGMKADQYRDQGDVLIGHLVDMYERNEIDKKVFQRMTTLVIMNVTQSTIRNMTSDLVRTHAVLPEASNTNKICFIDYSKVSYA